MEAIYDLTENELSVTENGTEVFKTKTDITRNDNFHFVKNKNGNFYLNLYENGTDIALEKYDEQFADLGYRDEPFSIPGGKMEIINLKCIK